MDRVMPKHKEGHIIVQSPLAAVLLQTRRNAACGPGKCSVEVMFRCLLGPAVLSKADVSRASGRWRPQHSRTTSGDRKSTRLNSSHVAISYAVFCLKKK